ncbi:DUF927 domain-containing protein [Falsiroseomonas sp.]|uniref:DUF927 domain-containing protein n=1 Tax=Falsiroseomonas sp. TaxID=2870721 RepID=UPI003F6ECCB3
MSEHTGTPKRGSADPFAPLKMNGVAHHPAPPPDTKEVWEPTATPLSVDPPEAADLFHPGFGKAVACWHYRDAEGALLFVVARFERRDGSKVKKDVTPFCHGRRMWIDSKGARQDRTGWHMKAPPAPRPLYGLPALAARPKAPVLLVEGEKTADAAAKLFPDHVVIASQGGSKAASKSDWSVLIGRDIVGWPDRDKPGLAYMNEAAALARPPLRVAKAKSFRIVEVPRDWPEGWDLADPLPAGGSPELLAELLAEAQDADPPQLPPNFVFREAGLFYDQAAALDEDLPQERIFITAPFEVVGEANDGTGMDWGLVIRWRDRDEREHQWSVPKRLIHADGSRIAEELENAGLHCDPSSRARNLLKKFIGGVRSNRRRVCVDRTGWHVANGKHVFILPGGEAYGPAASTVILQTEHAGSDNAFRAAGTLQEWQDNIGRLAVGNSRLALGICISLATPLLDILGGESGGFHLVGEPRKGKSTIAYAAGSVWGRGERGAQVRNWKATGNGLEGAAADTSDTVLILDEIGQALANEVADTVYMLANGSGKQRAEKSGSARRARTWRTQFLSTGEMTLAAKMGEAGKRMMGGLEVRLVNLPSDAGAGMGAFQNLHGAAAPEDFAKQIEAAARTYYGTAARSFLSHLVRARVSAPERLIERAKAARSGFTKKHVPTGASSQVTNVAERFALLGIAGELGAEWGVLPWPKGEAMAAAAACFRAWLGERGSVASGDDIQAIAQVRSYLLAHGESRFVPLKPDYTRAEGPIIQNRVGWRTQAGKTGPEFLIESGQWASEVCKGFDPRRVLKVLAAHGVLVRRSDGRLIDNQHIPEVGNTVPVYRISAGIFSMETEAGAYEPEEHRQG